MIGVTETVRLYTIPEAAAQLGVSRYYVYARLTDGTLSTVELGTDAKPKRRVRSDELQRFIDSRSA